jgi:hypothetical protein
MGWRERRLSSTMRQLHIAGESMFVDYGGKMLEVVNGTVSELRMCQLLSR